MARRSGDSDAGNNATAEGEDGSAAANPVPRVTLAPSESVRGDASQGGVPRPSPFPAEASKSTSPSSLAPPTKESFDALAKRVAKSEPRRGSVVQPPPAWQPDEVTLGFAMVADKSGGTHELPEPTLLATILIAAENDRRAILHRFAGGFDEEIDAVANLFWPFLVVHDGPKSAAAIFDGTGVWRRTFRYTLLPSVDGVRPLLDATLAPAPYLAQMRNLTPYFSRVPGAAVLTVEGFLPLDPPLLFDVLSQSQFRADPQSAHAGFLPARHHVEWYDSVVQEMRKWLVRFETDLRTLSDVRTRIDAIVK